MGQVSSADTASLTAMDGFRSTRILEMDLAAPVPAVSALDPVTGERHGTALVLVRLFTEPVGLVKLPLGDDGAPAEIVAAAIRAALSGQIAARLGGADLTRVLREGAEPPAHAYPQRRTRLLADAPHATVVLCTRDRAVSLRRTLAALKRLDYPSYDVLVVDNAPTTDATAAAVAAAAKDSDVEIRRVVEPRPGLSWARNCGHGAASGSVIASIDDDEVPDRLWLAELVSGFAAGPKVGCVTGMILPAEIRTQAQDWFEQYGGHSKGRAELQQRVFDLTGNRRQHPLYPLPPFGAGGNMAFSREAVETIGYFDTALGAGTPTRGAEDTAAFSDVLLAGYQLVHQPSAFVWHHHYADYDELKAQLYGYGVGLSSYFVRALRRHPRAALGLAGMVPRALRDYAAADGVRKESISDLPKDVLRQHMRGMVRGLTAYPSSVRQQRRVAARAR